ncbi:hypothetical protein [Burkholderia vietnamiensis]|uniref:hypothetical protein n=1 Tax=Burkholderia vietnamiensis TaxID=60552 RepID=UPI000751E58A|nr:hypothetical protein [Burkholderia vietnamiensis]KVE76995.1 hypothetical protein WI98_09110 [Burkholderia vietnamiensis]
MTKPNPLIELFANVRNAPGNKNLYDHYGDVRAVIPGKPLVRSIIDLNGDLLPTIESDDGMSLKRPPVGRPAVEVTTIGTGVIKQSLVAQAGAKVVIWEDPTEAVSTGLTGDVLMVSKPAYFETFEAAPFAIVPDGGDVGITPLPIKRAQIHVDAAGGLQTGTAIYGLRFEFDRATLKSYPNFENAIMHAITHGLARTADAVLLSAIVAAAPAPFSLSAAAAAAVRFGELRALVGTTAAGAAVGQDGVLRAAGIAAEMTPDMAATIVGAFARSAIMIRSEVDVIAERVKLPPDQMAGGVAFTAWAAMQPLLPDTSRFWTVGA